MKLIIAVAEMPICEGKVSWAIIVLWHITDMTRLFVLLYVNNMTLLSLLESMFMKTSLAL